MRPRSLTVLMGPAGSGKLNTLVERYRDSLEASQQSGRKGHCLWLAPSRLSVDNVRQALVDQLPGGVLQPGIFTFDNFADSQIATSNRHIRPITALQKKFLLQLVVQQAFAADQLAYFEPVARTPGFLLQLDQWVAEKKRSDVWAEQFGKTAQTRRDRELALLYGNYQRLLTIGNLYDGEGRFWAARDALGAETSADSRFNHIVVYGFSDFTSAQLDILRLLSERCEQMQIALTADSGSLSGDWDVGRSLLFSCIKKTYGQLQGVLPDLKTETNSPNRADQPLPDTSSLRTKNSKSSLRCAEQRLFGGSGVSEVLPVGIEVVAAAGPQQELELIAARIKERLLLGSSQPEHIAIVTRNISASAARIAEVLDDHGIPHWMESRPRLAGGAGVRTLVDMLRLKLEDWPFRLLLDLVGNRTLTVFDEPEEMRPRVCLEESIRAAQIPSGKMRLLEQLERWSAPTTGEQAESAPRIVVARELLEQLAARLDDLPHSAEITTWVEHLESLLVATASTYTFTLQPVSGWKALAGELRGLHHAQSWALEEPQPIDLRQLVRLLQMIADHTATPASHDAVGRVRVLSTETARHLTVPHLYLVDVGEQAFSSASSGGHLDASGQRSQEEVLADQADMMYLFYTLITRASESLTVSYPAMDDKGQPLPPSPMLEELRRCFQPHPIATTIQSPGLHVVEHSSSWSQSAHRMRAVVQAQSESPILLAGLATQSSSTGRGMLAGIGAVASRVKRDSFGEYEGILNGPTIATDLASRFDSEHLWSPSQLEEYANCPFRFFAGQLLSLSPPKDITVASDLGRRGSMLHQVLADVHQKLSTQSLELPDDESAREALAERFRQALAEEVAAHPLSGLEAALREIERREIDAWANQYAEQEMRYRHRWEGLDQPPRPAYFEVRFGPQVAGSADETSSPLSTPVPFELDLGEQQIRITGQIDRIDVGRIGTLKVFNVIDYKSGKEVRFKPEDLTAGRQLQLPLYALAAEELLFADQQAEAMAVGYWSIQGKGFEQGALRLKSPEGGTLQASTEWQQLQVQLIATLRKLVDGIQSGQYPVYNQDEHCTSWCPYRTICRIGQIRSLEKQWPPLEDSSR